MNFGVRKLESRGYRLACMILRLAVLIQYWRHTTTAYTVLSITLHGKNGSLEQNQHVRASYRTAGACHLLSAPAALTTPG